MRLSFNRRAMTPGIGPYSGLAHAPDIPLPDWVSLAIAGDSHLLRQHVVAWHYVTQLSPHVQIHYKSNPGRCQ